MIRQSPLLEQNNRVSRLYSNRDRMEETKRADYLASAEKILEALVPAKEGWRRYIGVPDMGWGADTCLLATSPFWKSVRQRFLTATELRWLRS